MADTAINLNVLYDKVKSMPEEEAKMALNDEQFKTKLLLEATHQI